MDSPAAGSGTGSGGGGNSGPTLIAGFEIVHFDKKSLDREEKFDRNSQHPSNKFNPKSTTHKAKAAAGGTAGGGSPRRRGNGKQNEQNNSGGDTESVPRKFITVAEFSERVIQLLLRVAFDRTLFASHHWHKLPTPPGGERRINDLSFVLIRDAMDPSTVAHTTTGDAGAGSSLPEYFSEPLVCVRATMTIPAPAHIVYTCAAKLDFRKAWDKKLLYDPDRRYDVVAPSAGDENGDTSPAAQTRKSGKSLPSAKGGGHASAKNSNKSAARSTKAQAGGSSGTTGSNSGKSTQHHHSHTKSTAFQFGLANRDKVSRVLHSFDRDSDLVQCVYQSPPTNPKQFTLFTTRVRLKDGTLICGSRSVLCKHLAKLQHHSTGADHSHGSEEHSNFERADSRISGFIAQPITSATSSDGSPSGVPHPQGTHTAFTLVLLLNLSGELIIADDLASVTGGSGGGFGGSAGASAAVHHSSAAGSTGGGTGTGTGSGVGGGGIPASNGLSQQLTSLYDLCTRLAAPSKAGSVVGPPPPATTTTTTASGMSVTVTAPPTTTTSSGGVGSPKLSK